MKYYRQLPQILFGHRNLRRYFCAKVTKKSSHLQEEYNERMEKVKQIVPLFKNALLFPDKMCVTDFKGQYTYRQLYANSKRLSRQISNICGSGSGSSIIFFISNDVLTLLILWSIWMSGQTAIVLTSDLENLLLEHLVKVNKPSLIISSDKYENCSRKIAFDNSIPLISVNHKFLKIDPEHESSMVSQKKAFYQDVLFNDFYKNSEALSIYSIKNNEISSIISLNHNDLNAQIRKAVKALNISGNERIVYICPSFHSYNMEYIFNMLFPLSVGSHIYIFEPFDIKSAWRCILGINKPLKERVNIIIAEPEVYQLLIQEYNKIFSEDPKMLEYIKDYCLSHIRLMMSCFVHLHPSIFSTWLKITGHSLLECDFLNDFLNLIRKNNANNPSNKCLTQNPCIRLRIVDADNKILLELDGTQRFRTSHMPIVGRLMIAKPPNETFHYTGEIVAYNNGVFMKVGRYHHYYRSN